MPFSLVLQTTLPLPDIPANGKDRAIAEEILRVKERILGRGYACGIMATDLANGQKRIEQGFSMIGLAADAGLIIRGITEMLQGLGKPLNPDVWRD